ncbi:MAG: transporter substrate-binding domain-containing protein [Granulosicoccus sp.]
MSDKSIKIGVLFSQSGPMAVTECAHLQGIMLACEEINSSGGINGTPIDPIILDPKGNDAKYAQYATELILKHRVNSIFGCCLSSSRKAVVPIVERYNGILFYPSVYEGFEYSTNVIYGGAVPNQMVLPLLEYIFENYGRKITLIGSDTLYSREINRIVSEFLQSSNGTILSEIYLPLGSTYEQTEETLNDIDFGDSVAILSTVVGEDSVTLYNAFSKHELSKTGVRIASLTTTESELGKMSPESRSDHISVSPYFGSLKTAQNNAFVCAFQKRFGEDSIPGVYSEVCYSMIHLFANATCNCDWTETDNVLAALSGSVFKGPSGDLFIDMETNHFTLRPLIGKSTKQGSFDIIYKSPQVVRADPYLVSYDRSVKGQLTG